MTSPSVTTSPPELIERACSASRPAPDADISYVLRAKKGDQTAFAPLWEKYWRSLYNYFARHISSRDEAEDLASETLLAAFDRLPAFRGQTALSAEPSSALSLQDDSTEPAPQCTFQTYLRAIARNKLALWIRNKTKRPTSDFTELETPDSLDEESASREQNLSADADANPLHALLQQDQRAEVYSALTDVGMRSTEQFKALFLHYCCDISHKDIATILKTRSETINTRLQEGRRTLARYYQRTSEQDSKALPPC